MLMVVKEKARSKLLKLVMMMAQVTMMMMSDFLISLILMFSYFMLIVLVMSGGLTRDPSRHVEVKIATVKKGLIKIFLSVYFSRHFSLSPITLPHVFCLIFQLIGDMYGKIMENFIYLLSGTSTLWIMLREN